MLNRFAYIAVQSKLVKRTDNESKKLYTDTDPDEKSAIITDVTIMRSGKAGSQIVEVKVDPEAEINYIVLHKFKYLFPHICRDGQPKAGVLVPNGSEFSSYSGSDLQSYWHLIIATQYIVTKKFHPMRYYIL